MTNTDSRKIVGVLALQGCVDPHLVMLESVGVRAITVRSPAELQRCDRLIMPGGESTTMLKLLELSGLLSPLLQFGKSSPVWGICAGAILCAKEVEHPKQLSLGLINIRAYRNYYGSQLDSFKSDVSIKGIPRPIAADFIRAPKLEPLSDSVTVLARSSDGTAILLREGQILASAFHTELGVDAALHDYFIQI